MNKMEKLICIVLGLVLVWYVYSEMGRQKKRAEEARAALAAAPAPSACIQPAAPVPSAPPPPAVEETALHDTFVSISNDQEVVTFASNERGVAIRRITLLQYARDCGELSDENPPVTLDFGSRTRALALSGALARGGVLETDSPTSVVFRASGVTRRFVLAGDYRILVSDAFAGDAAGSGVHTLALGAMQMGSSKNDLLSVDSLLHANDKGKPEVVHHCDEEPLKAYLVGGIAGGCSGSSNASGMPESTSVTLAGRRDWVAVKNRFFVTALAACDQPNGGFSATIARNMFKTSYQPREASVDIQFAEAPAQRTYVFYAGPKKQSLLWELGMRDVMEFGIWRWVCYPLVWVLNIFHDWVPNYGFAIILLTILVRILFWPLTHKSTLGMRKLQEIQPKMKAIQAKFKDNPQRLQQETWALYRSEKVNPMSSCLPMLVQIPVFIALFNVLRSAVELRYAPFLWIADLSEPEGLFANVLPFGGLNILPILMAISTGLQSAFTPSSGDARQQRMMMIMMPAMMLVMFYSFPAALSLYWFLSNLVSIVQMWLIRRQTAQRTEVLEPEVIDPPTTRQMRRHG